MRIGVIGPAGFGGSYLCVELIQRGHHVVGLSRRPHELGSHKRYEPRIADIDALSIEDFGSLLRDLDVVISEYGPHTAGADALQYMPFVETTRKIVLAVRFANVGYFIMVGGAGSLHFPGGKYGEVLGDNPNFFPAYRRAIADSEAHTQYMEERLGPMGGALRKYRNARLALRSGKPSESDHEAIRTYEAALKGGDRASEFIRAARTSYMFFDGNESFRWSYASPPPMYRPGRRTGQYEITIDNVKLKDVPSPGQNPLEDRLTGISVSDMAIALADEAEQQRLVRKHWTATGDLSDDTPAKSYVKL